jgi:sugar phosphate isomerase/epimerase
MKLACASTAFDWALQQGDLTQLEWLDLCGRDLAADGVVCDLRHFPRHDSDYLAQVKKLAADLGLTVAALWSADFFGASEEEMLETLAIAEAIGAPLLSAPVQNQTQTTWPDALERVGVATRLAKSRNITLAVRNALGSFAAGAHDLRRLSKEADSAWLRFGVEVDALDAASDPKDLLDKTVLLWHMHAPAELESDELPKTRRILDLANQFHGFLALEITGGRANRESMHNALRKWRTMLAEDLLGEAL